MRLAFLFLMLFSANVFATQFVPLPIDKQVEEATSGAEVVLASSRVFKNAVGNIMTEYGFDISESYNLPVEELEDQKLKLVMPGGTLNGMTAMIDGAPQFVQGEKTFLLLKKIENKIYLSNFTLGKYKIQEVEGKIYYVSEVFPFDQEVGRISKEKMIELMKTKWKMTSSNENKYQTLAVQGKTSEVKKMQFRKRAPAQENQSEDVPVFFWSALLLVSVFFGLIFFKIGQSEQDKKSE